jgi:hypothetical protein
LEDNCLKVEWKTKHRPNQYIFEKKSVRLTTARAVPARRFQPATDELQRSVAAWVPERGLNQRNLWRRTWLMGKRNALSDMVSAAFVKIMQRRTLLRPAPKAVDLRIVALAQCDSSLCIWIAVVAVPHQAAVPENSTPRGLADPRYLKPCD